MYVRLALLVFLGLAVYASAQFQDVHSLKGPFTLPFWSMQGNAQVTENFVRLAEDRQNKRGSLWNVVPNMFANWEVTFSFRIHGVSTYGADGLAFWYTEKIDKAGSLFGNDEYFKGIGIVVDTYDNDGAGVHPYVMLLQNDGTKKFNPEHEHGVHKEHDEGELELGGCTLHVRNLETPSTLRITYFNHRLTVEASLEDGAFTRCIDVNKIDLQPGHYFGFTAATGQLADNHDVHRFVVRGLDPQGKPQDLPVCGEGSNVGRALSQVQHELAESKKQLQTLLDKLSSGAPIEGRQSETGAVADPQLQTNVADLRRTVERSNQALETRLHDIERKVVSASTYAKEAGEAAGSSLLSWITSIVLLVTCGAVLYFQYKAHLHRKQKFF
ncbi:uncharacterized protein ACA1_070410 [Acanthamoeba castellanii str. Neff]|uniref:L-type lectin-like domain-containing protein n=1 Tax=Acanthamoeba castellanii (strain ATCC 30010 / Neff) TaxID=1257118 RepID=L8HFA0_ACACF|nr:uncharacterized protein ACA1_070410 [Acanthamoeba castellanii str. Neff]ELR23433.1 hypothetical protein ACA1_070410 [Acanthamoeba castellanii str. Neff]